MNVTFLSPTMRIEPSDSMIRSTSRKGYRCGKIFRMSRILAGVKLFSIGKNSFTSRGQSPQFPSRQFYRLSRHRFGNCGDSPRILRGENKKGMAPLSCPSLKPGSKLLWLCSGGCTRGGHRRRMGGIIGLDNLVGHYKRRIPPSLSGRIQIHHGAQAFLLG